MDAAGHGTAGTLLVVVMVTHETTDVQHPLVVLGNEITHIFLIVLIQIFLFGCFLYLLFFFSKCLEKMF